LYINVYASKKISALYGKSDLNAQWRTQRWKRWGRPPPPTPIGFSNFSASRHFPYKTHYVHLQQMTTRLISASSSSPLQNYWIRRRERLMQFNNISDFSMISSSQQKPLQRSALLSDDRCFVSPQL